MCVARCGWRRQEANGIVAPPAALTWARTTSRAARRALERHTEVLRATGRAAMARDAEMAIMLTGVW